MSRALRARLELLEASSEAAGWFTEEALLQTAQNVRAGLEVDKRWTDLFTPDQIVRMAALQVGP